MTCSKPDHHSCLTWGQAILRCNLKFAPTLTSHVTVYKLAIANWIALVIWFCASTNTTYMLIMCEKDGSMLMCMHKNLSCQKSLWNVSFIQIVNQNHDPEAGLKHSKAWEQKNLCSSRGSASVLAIQYCSLLSHKTIKALYKGSILCSLVWLIGVKRYIAAKAQFLRDLCEQCHSFFFFLGYKGILYVSGLNIWHCIKIWQANCYYREI